MVKRKPKMLWNKINESKIEYKIKSNEMKLWDKNLLFLKL